MDLVCRCDWGGAEAAVERSRGRERKRRMLGIVALSVKEVQVQTTWVSKYNRKRGLKLGVEA